MKLNEVEAEAKVVVTKIEAGKEAIASLEDLGVAVVYCSLMTPRKRVRKNHEKITSIFLLPIQIYINRNN